MGQKLRINRQNFNGGEYGERVQMRSDLDPYRKGCNIMKDAVPSIYGTAARRAGMLVAYEFADFTETVYPSGHRAFDFEYDDVIVHQVVLRIYDFETVKVWISGVGDIGDIDAFYRLDDFKKIQYFQSGDVLFLFHPDYPTQRIERRSIGTWVIREHNYIGGPMLTSNPSGQAGEESIIHTIDRAYIRRAEMINDNTFDSGLTSADTWSISGDPVQVPLWRTLQAWTLEMVIEFTGVTTLDVGEVVDLTDFKGPVLSPDAGTGLTLNDFDLAQATVLEVIHTSGPEPNKVIFQPGGVISRQKNFTIVITRSTSPEAYPGETESAGGVTLSDRHYWYFPSVNRYSDNGYAEWEFLDIPSFAPTMTEIDYFAEQDAGNVTALLRIKEYTPDSPHQPGDCVYDGGDTDFNITESGLEYWKSTFNHYAGAYIQYWRYYTLRLKITGTIPFESGDSIYLANMADWTGWHQVVEVGADYATVDSLCKELIQVPRYGGGPTVILRRYFENVAAPGPAPGDFPIVPPDPVGDGAIVTVTDFETVTYYQTLKEAVAPTNALTDEEYFKPIGFVMGEVEIQLNSGVFSLGDVGRTVALYKGNKKTSGTFASSQESEIIPCHGEITLTTREGVWKGLAELLESQDGVSWEVVASIEAKDSKHNETLTRTASSLHSVFKLRFTRDTGSLIWFIDTGDSEYIYGKITAYTSPIRATVYLDTPITENFSSNNFRLSAIGGSQGNPSFGFINNERLVIGGIPGSGNQMFLSQTNDWTKWNAGTLATSSFDFIFPSFKSERGLWGMNLGEGMIVGTTGAEWHITVRDSREGISLENFKVEPISNIGSAPIQPVKIKNQIIFINSDLRTLTVIKYEYESDGMITEQLDILSDHIPAANVRMMCVVMQPFPVVWLLDENSNIYSITIDAGNQVTGFAQHDVQILGGLALGITSINSMRRGSDWEVWVSVSMEEGENYINLYKMQFNGDSGYQDKYTGVEGVHNPVQFLLEPTLITQDGETLNGSDVWKFASVDVFLIQSQGGEISIDGGETWWPIPYEDGELFTGRKRVELNAFMQKDPRLQIRCNDDNNKPFEISAFSVVAERTNSEVN